MPTIVQIDGLKVQMYADDHFPPHFHIVGREFEVLVSLRGLAILKGKRHRREIMAALEWAEANLDLLWKEWERLNEE